MQVEPATFGEASAVEAVRADAQVAADRASLGMLIRGFQVSCLIRLVTELGVPDTVPADRRWDVHDLATACAVSPRPLLRVLRALSAFGIFQVTSDGTVGHSPRSLLLRSDAEHTLRHAARFYTAPGAWRAWGVVESALVDQIPHVVAWGEGRFDYLRAHPDEARVFDEFMAHSLEDSHAAIAAACDFSHAASIVDVGGGNGEALRRILARFPHLTAVLLDREDVLAAIPPTALMEGRIRLEAGSFFERVPSNADVYLLVRVLHDWPDEECSRILEICRQAVSAQSRLLICEQILNVDPAVGAPASYLVDVQMLAMFGSARERVEHEYRELLAGAGFRCRSVRPITPMISIIEAVPG